jgi:2-polyprenyl-3-methyl-5-hydroxy-6-metoxy-1,4-benzoquinol methylase
MIQAQMARWAKRKVRRGLGWIETAYARQLGLRASQTASSAARALAWVRRHESPSGGIYVHSRYHEGYAEVTGYLIATLLQYGERELAARLLRWLVCAQRADGAFTDPNEGQPNVFDTGQALRGLLAGAGLVPQALDAARRAADYLCAEMDDGGRGGFGPRYRSARYRGEIPESIHLYALPPVRLAASVFQEPRYAAAAERCCDYYQSHDDALRLETLTHYLAYELDALIDLGRADLAIPLLDALAADQHPDGGVPGVRGAAWVCAPGLAQLAVCWYKLGRPEPADRAVRWLEAHQQPSGGWLGSYGEHASYFADGEELSWAAKFFLDAHLLRVRSFFGRNARPAPSDPRGDGARAVLSVANAHDRVLEAGYGTGSVVQAVSKAYPRARCCMVNPAVAPLTHIPSGPRTLQGVLEAIPCREDSFDVTCSVEAIEHSANPQAVVAELTRATRQGGWVVIVSAQRADGGRERMCSWQRCPGASDVARWLRRGCDGVTVEVVAGPGRAGAGAVVVCKGRKRRPLARVGLWRGGWISAQGGAEVVHRVAYNRISDWAQAAVLSTRHGERVLALGGGAGDISLHLARAGRAVTVAASSGRDLNALRVCARQLGLSLGIVQADETRPLVFGDDAFDCVLCAGLLEHIAAPARQAALRSWARAAAGTVIVLTSNAACLAYRVAKAYQEERGVWPYGLELPAVSLRDEFEAAGLRVLSEQSVGARHALSFLPARHALRRALSSWMTRTASEAAQDCHQGFALITVGTKRRP